MTTLNCMGILRVVQLSTLVFKQDIKLQDNQRKKTWAKEKENLLFDVRCDFLWGTNVLHWRGQPMESRPIHIPCTKKIVPFRRKIIL